MAAAVSGINHNIHRCPHPHTQHPLSTVPSVSIKSHCALSLSNLSTEHPLSLTVRSFSINSLYLNMDVFICPPIPLKLLLLYFRPLLPSLHACLYFSIAFTLSIPLSLSLCVPVCGNPASRLAVTLPRAHILSMVRAGGRAGGQVRQVQARRGQPDPEGRRGAPVEVSPLILPCPHLHPLPSI